MDEKWTPGPWRWSEHGSCWLQGAMDDSILHVDDYGDTVPKPADRCLIAAAPDMADVCVELRRLSLVIESAVRYADPHHGEAIWALIRANDAALAKALDALEPREERRDGDNQEA